jgi:hypothetical protein
MEKSWFANRRLLLNSSDPIVSILFWEHNIQCQSHWMDKSSIPKTDYVPYFIYWVTGRWAFSRGLYCINLLLCNSYWRHRLGGGSRADDFKADSLIRYSLDKEDHQDYVICGWTYSNSIRDLGSNRYINIDSIGDLLKNNFQLI